MLKKKICEIRGMMIQFLTKVCTFCLYSAYQEQEGILILCLPIIKYQHSSCTLIYGVHCHLSRNIDDSAVPDTISSGAKLIPIQSGKSPFLNLSLP
ncbi:hypothetical protein BT93_K2246 [Corymbia citriodora subsp. variegata]|nr:hypothetical protein BT93_K2246 [Corymbia citriodora subsp. variegata]